MIKIETANKINHIELVEYRPKRQKSWSEALVWDDQPRSALAHTLGVPERELIIRRPTASTDKPNSKDFV